MLRAFILTGLVLTAGSLRYAQAADDDVLLNPFGPYRAAPTYFEDFNDGTYSPGYFNVSPNRGPGFGNTTIDLDGDGGLELVADSSGIYNFSKSIADMPTAITLNVGQRAIVTYSHFYSRPGNATPAESGGYRTEVSFGPGDESNDAAPGDPQDGDPWNRFGISGINPTQGVPANIGGNNGNFSFQDFRSQMNANDKRAPLPTTIYGPSEAPRWNQFALSLELLSFDPLADNGADDDREDPGAPGPINPNFSGHKLDRGFGLGKGLGQARVTTLWYDDFTDPANPKWKTRGEGIFPVDDNTIKEIGLLFWHNDPNGTDQALGAFNVAKVDTVLAGDVNLDGSVNNFDFAILAPNFGLTGDYGENAVNPLYRENGDLNSDGTVDNFDFAALAGSFNQTYTAPLSTEVAAVPEPSSVLLALGGVVGLLIARRRFRGSKI